MKNNRRDFLKLSSLAGLGIAGGSVLQGFTAEPQKGPYINKSSIQTFNMSGYAAPKLETVRVGFIGLGQRGPSHLNAIAKIEGTEIKALCDLREESVNKAKKVIEGTSHKPVIYTGGPDEWKKLCDRKDIDLVYIATPWDLHVPMAVYAMNQGKHVTIEVPAAVS
ncbi:MAG: Gfo/Idh/MocA family oxidoreductase, partial [Pedobacter sp.]